MTHALTTVNTDIDHLGASYTVHCRCGWNQTMFTELPDVINHWGIHVAREALNRHHELETRRATRPAVGPRYDRRGLGVFRNPLRRRDPRQPAPHPPAPRHLELRSIPGGK